MATADNRPLCSVTAGWQDGPMLLRLPLPDFPENASVRLLAWCAEEGDALPAGATLLDLLVDLSAGIEQDCPPTSVSRIVLRESAWLVSRHVAEGATIATGGTIALLGTGPDMPRDAAVARDVRVTVAAVLHHADWWGG